MDQHTFLFNAELIDLSDSTHHPFLSNLQGNILKAHARRFTRNIFLGFHASCQREIKATIARLAQDSTNEYWWTDLRITSAFRQMEQSNIKHTIPSSTFFNLFFSARGYEFFDITPPNDPAFQIGMGESLEWPSYVQSDLIKNLKEGPAGVKNTLRASLKTGQINKGKWIYPYDQDIHAMILLANSEEPALEAAEKNICQLFKPLSNLIHVERGSRLPPNDQGNSTEHFGYVDNISNPIFFKQDYEKAKARELPAQFDKHNPKASLSLVLVDDPYGGENAYGSYLVFQKLEQNVKRFSDQIDQLRERLGISKELAEAFVIGRFKDGTPVIMSSISGMNPPPNNFNYYEDEWDNDNVGMRCPLHAHIRKMNPRHGLYRDNRIVRRGITYDDRTCSSKFLPKHSQEASSLPEEHVGILFMCFQSNIGKQYEALIKEWGLQGTPKSDVGADPILAFNDGSHHDSVEQNWPLRWGGMKPIQQKEALPWNHVIRNLGGGYFFAPSLSFLKSLPSFP